MGPTYFPFYRHPSRALVDGMVDVLDNALAANAWAAERKLERWVFANTEAGGAWVVVLVDFDSMPEAAKVEVLAISNAFQAGYLLAMKQRRKVAHRRLRVVS